MPTKKPKIHPMNVLRGKFAAFKPFEKMLADGDICDTERAAELTGFTVYHIQRLCKLRKVEHERRHGTQYYFTPAQIEALRLKTVKPKISR